MSESPQLSRKLPPTDRDFEIYESTLRGDTTVATYRTFLLNDLPAAIRGRYRRRLTVPTRLAIGERDVVIGERDTREQYERGGDVDQLPHEPPGPVPPRPESNT